MDRWELEKNYPTLEKIVNRLMILPEIMFILLDKPTVRLRDKAPRALKRHFPISCRLSNYFGNIRCGPARWYYHKMLFKYVVCKYYDPESKGCSKYPRE